jgi:flavin-dependent dehydrogenase
MREPEEDPMSSANNLRENLVIGGGLAGAMTALRLAAAGRDVVLLEKERAADHKVCGEFLSPEAVEYLRGAGLEPRRLGAQAIGNLRLCAGRTMVEAPLPFPALSLSRRVLDAALLARAAEAGCHVRRGTAVQELSRAGGCWAAELSDGSTQCADHIFLATGKHDLHGWNRPTGSHGDLVGFKLHWRLNAAQTEALRGFMDLYLFDGGYGGLSLAGGDVANLCLVVRRARLRALGGWRELLAQLRRENSLVRARLGGAEAAWDRPLAISSIPYGFLCEKVHGVWPVGDQAAVIPSFTGDGMAIALHSAAVAAQMYLAGKNPGEYLRELKDHLKGSMRVATILSRTMVSRSGQQLVSLIAPLLSQPIRWIARSTRIPGSALQAHANS